MRVKVLRTLCAKEDSIPVYAYEGTILEGDMDSFPKCVRNALEAKQENLVRILIPEIEKVTVVHKKASVSVADSVLAQSQKVVSPAIRKRRGV